jgi:hypothetical protein
MRGKKHAVKPEEHRAKAVEYHDELKSEIEEPSPEGQKVIEDVVAVQHEPAKAQAERKAMRTERRVGEAEPPLPKR